MGLKKRYVEFKSGVINDIEASEIPFDAMVKSDGFYYKENFWRKIPGLTELNAGVIGTDPVWGLIQFYRVTPKDSFLIAASGGSVYKYDIGSRTFTAIHTGMVPNEQVDFLEDNNFLYFGSKKDNWRRFDGGAKTQPVGGANPPKKFSRIIYAPSAQRFFGMGAEEDPAGLYYSEHIDDGGIEVWTAAPQIIESVKGDSPLAADIYEGNITTVSLNSISQGTVRGVPQSWVFDRQKAQAGTIAWRTFKRYKNFFLMLTPTFDLYKWPDNELVNKGRVKFSIDPSYAHLACAEVIDDRYYVLCFRSGEAVSSNKYHLWIYDILGDRFYGPHTQYNLVSMFYDKPNRRLLCGGIDNLAGFVFEFTGRNIKGVPKKAHLVTAYSDYGYPEIEKRYNKGWIKAKQEGNAPFNPLQDFSASAHAVSPIGGVSYSKTIKKFGFSSILFNGTTGHLTIPDHANFNFSGGVFTIETVLMTTSLSATQVIYAQGTAGGDEFIIQLNTNGSLELSIQAASETVVQVLTASGTIEASVFYHIAVVENGDTWKIFVNGEDKTSTGGTDTSRAANYTGVVSIGKRQFVSDNYFVGYLDELRVSSSARYSADFVPAYLPFEADANTVLLLHFDNTGEGLVQLIINTNNEYGNPQSQKISLEDPANENFADTNAVKEAVTKRFDIHDQYGLGNAIQIELIHEIKDGDFAFSGITIDYDPEEYEKEDAA